MKYRKVRIGPWCSGSMGDSKSLDPSSILGGPDMRLTEILHCLSVSQDKIRKDLLTHIDVDDKRTAADLIEVRAEVKRNQKKRDSGMFF